VLDHGELRLFYREGYERLRGNGKSVVVLSDAFMGPPWWNGFLTPAAGKRRDVAIGVTRQRLMGMG
jgi:hypothetical protein